MVKSGTIIIDEDGQYIPLVNASVFCPDCHRLICGEVPPDTVAICITDCEPPSKENNWIGSHEWHPLRAIGMWSMDTRNY